MPHRRGAGAWTAQFTTVIDATIDLVDDGGDVSTLEKPLQVTGRIAVASPGELESLNVTSVEALVGDPMRRVWTTRLADEYRIIREMAPQLSEAARRLVEMRDEAVRSAMIASQPGIGEAVRKMMEEQQAAARAAAQAAPALTDTVRKMVQQQNNVMRVAGPGLRLKLQRQSKK